MVRGKYLIFSLGRSMKKIVSVLLACLFLTACGSKADMSTASLENPLLIPLIEESSVFVTSNTITQARVDVAGTLLAFLQSEYDMRMADSAAGADYAIHLTIENFAHVKTDSNSVNAADVFLPALIGAVTGAQLGFDVGDGTGLAVGAGVGAVTGAGIGYAASGSQSRSHWQMLVSVDITDKHDESFMTRVDARVEGDDMDAQEAAQALEIEVAMAILKAFQKNF